MPVRALAGQGVGGGLGEDAVSVRRGGEGQGSRLARRKREGALTGKAGSECAEPARSAFTARRRAVGDADRLGGGNADMDPAKVE